MKYSNRSYVYDRFDITEGRRTKKEVANDYLNEVLAGNLVIITHTTIWGKEFVKLCKQCKVCPIYRNFSRNDEFRGEYSIHKTKAKDEIQVNIL